MRRTSLFGCAALLALGLTALLVPAAPAPRKVALLVGVNVYDKRCLSDLKYAERDVDELAKVLKASGFEVRLLKGSSTGDDRATLDNVRSSLDALLKKANKQDVVLVALAGHGQQIEVKDRAEAFFCPVDAVKGDPKTLLGLSDLVATLDGKGGVNLVLVDACRDDSNPDRARGIDGNVATKLPANTALFLSCSSRQRSFESEKAGGGHGVFFHFVLEGLRGGAVDKRGEVTWEGLVPYVKRRFKDEFADFVPAAPVRQRPHALANLSDDDPVLTTKDVGATKEESPKELTVALGGGVKLELVRIDAGEFQMGAPDGEKDAEDNEKPRHKVEITKPFYLGKYEVTQQQYEQLTGKTPSYFSASGGGKEKVKELETGRFPVENVSWDDAVAYCESLTSKHAEQVPPGLRRAGYKFALPTEAQWEYACRARKTSPFHFGDELNGEQANCNGNYPYGTTEKGPYKERTVTVGSYKANAFGLYDMHGNVWEWCADYYDKDFYGK